MYTTQEVSALGEQIAVTGLAPHTTALQRLAAMIRRTSPAAAELLVDASAPEVLRQRAFAVAADHVARLRS